MRGRTLDVLAESEVRVQARAVSVLRLRARWRIRRLVCCVSLTFGGFRFGMLSVCGLTCAAHIAGATHNPAYNH